MKQAEDLFHCGIRHLRWQDSCTKVDLLPREVICSLPAHKPLTEVEEREDLLQYLQSWAAAHRLVHSLHLQDSSGVICHPMQDPTAPDFQTDELVEEKFGRQKDCSKSARDLSATSKHINVTDLLRECLLGRAWARNLQGKSVACCSDVEEAMQSLRTLRAMLL